ncbi:VF_A0006 family four-cysteine protein [Burkholderia alba]|uniref:VF_A0006 family four-cysteine protein n=1 Tax=Burkholderia alba TaxID=2683677 RepID=UPI002B0548DB|nr:VF_A0006 family four-cysteine protein [Burkholderia alba]
MSILLAAPLTASAFGSDDQYDQCILQALRNSESSSVANILRSSCQSLYRDGAMLLPREKAYHACILQNLPGVRDSFAAQQIMQACSRRNQM